MKYKKRLLISLFIVGFITFSFVFISFNLTQSNNKVNLHTSGINDIEYEFDQDILHDSTDISYTNNYNVRNESLFSGHYPATYSFENEVGFENESISWVDTLDINTSAKILDSYNGHHSVLNWSYLKGSGNQWLRSYSLDYTLEGALEFWISFSSISSNNIIYTTDFSWNTIINLCFDNTLHYFNGTSDIDSGLSISENIWYHIKLEWSNTSQTYNLFLNGIEVNKDINYKDTSNSAYRFIFMTSIIDRSFYIDAVGNSWEVYNRYTFDDRPLYSYFNESVYPYTSWDYTDLGDSYAVFNDFVPITIQYLRLQDGSTGHLILKDNWNEQIVIGSVSFNFRGQDTQDCMNFQFSDGVFGVVFNMWYGELEYSNYPENIAVFNSNQWYKFQIDFDCIEHSFDVFIDDIFIKSYQLNPNLDYLTDILFSTAEQKWFDIDNLFYSFGNCIGDNMVSDKSYSNYYQTDNYEFTLNDVDTLTVIGSDNPLGWNDIESSGDNVNIVRQAWNGLVYIEGTGNGENNGIEKTDFNINNTFVEIDINFNFISLTDPTGYTYIDIHSNDSTLVIRFKFQTSGEFEYYNGSDFILINSDITINKNYRINFVVSYELSLSFLDFYVDDILINDTYIFPLITSDKIGLSEIVFDTYTFSVNQMYSLIDYIGIETNNFYPGELSFVGVNLNKSYNIKNHNLLTLDVNGNVSILASDNSYTPLGYSSLLVNDVLYNESEVYLINTYDDYIESYDLGRLIFYLNSNFSLFYVYIEGVLLIEGINEYFPSYASGNVDTSESYWFVSSNKLYYTLNCNDNETEYILISFNIDNIITYAYSFMFTGINYNMFGREIRFNYLSGKTSILSLTYGIRIERFSFPSNQILTSIAILITDDGNYNNYESNGYFYDFILRPSSEHDIDISTSDFITALIPLLFFILLPSLLVIYSINKTGSSDDLRKKLFIPILAVFCLISYVFAQIDLWMLFLILLGFINLFLANRSDLNG